MADRAYRSIQDDGPGLSPAAGPRILDPFFTAKPPGKGTGPGLSICKSIAEEFDGHIEVSGADGEGAAFLLSFPGESMEESPKRKTA